MLSLRRPNLLLLAVLILAAAAGCGKRGPPRAPLPRTPERVSAVTARRLGAEVVVRFTIPTANADGRAPADVERVDVYAYTGSPAGDETIDILKQAAVIGSVKVRKPPQPEEEDRKALERKKQQLPPPPPPEPKPPGTYDQGETASVTETLTPVLTVPDKVVVAAREKMARRAAPPVFNAFRWPGPMEMPRRYYAAVAVSSNGKKSGLSQRVIVPMFRPTSPPAIADFLYTETAITVLWTPPADAPRPIIGEPATAALAPTAAPTPEAPTPPKPVAVLEPLTSRSIVPNRLPVTYNVYDTKPDESGVIKPLNPTPLAAPVFVDTRLEFGTERCYVVRTVTPVGDLTVEGDPSEARCVTPVDIFPPAPPRNLAAVGGEGVISLIWEPNTEADLGGYLLLRGEAPGEKLLALTPAPIRETTFRDTTVKPGVRYVYVVQAVDNVEKPNVSAPSNRVEEAARD
ncbi:MAG: fibronectin type III domain-containing protein [Acidobacteria bacterium]|nr:fibronectin type III domain-containing protein [Acidobacteriota bacterium]